MYSTMSKQRTRKFVTKILRKTCSSLEKIISDGENNFTQNNYNKLQKINAKNTRFFTKNKCKSANMGSSTVQLQGAASALGADNITQKQSTQTSDEHRQHYSLTVPLAVSRFYT